MTAAGWKMLGSIGLVVALAYIGMIVLLALFQRSLIYQPDTSNAGTPQQAGLNEGRIIEVTTQDGLNLKGWYTENKDGNAPVVLYYHGNAGHHGWRAHKIEALYQAGFSVLIAGYRGYGGNPGKPYEKGVYKDGQAYYEWLVKQNTIVPENIIIYGESLGTGVATKIARDNKAAGLILETPFDSLTAVAKLHYPYIPFIDVLLRDNFPNDERITKIEMPVLVMVAGKDNVVPSRRGKRLYDIARQPKHFHKFDQATHNGIDVQDLLKHISDFVSRYVQ